MDDGQKSKAELLDEVAQLRQRVSDLEATETVLRESERRLQEAQKMAHLGNWWWDVKSGAVEWSEEIYRIFQQDPETFTPQIDSILALSPWPEENARDQELIQRAIESREPGSYEQRFLRPDGTIGYYASTFQGIYDDDGDLIAMKGTVLDITERRQAQQALVESETRFRSIVEAMPLGMHFYELRADGRLVFSGANPAADTILGVSNVQFVGKTIEEAFPPLAATQIPERYREVAETGKLWHNEQVDYEDDLISGAFEVHAFQTAPNRMAAAFQDITERKRSEERLRESEGRLQLIVQNMPVMMDAFDDDLNILVWNRECERVTGYRADEIVGNPNALNLLYPDDDYREQMIKEWSERGDDYYHWEWDLIAKDGSRKTISWSNIAAAFPIPGWATWGLGVDVTARKQVEKHHLELALEKEQSETLRVLMSNISHDIKTPLSTINVSLYLLERHSNPEKKQEKIDNIKAQVRVLENFVQDLMAVAQLDSEPDLKLTLVDVGELVIAIEADFQPLAEQKEIAFRLELDETMTPILADEADLRRAVTNLVENALHYTPQAGSVRVRTHMQADNTILIEVIDTGIGIGEEDLPHIFNRFYRAVHAQSMTGSGSGLGLAIAKRVVEAHRGQVMVESVLGEGSTFRIQLPRQ